jgi:hypothetical protein
VDGELLALTHAGEVLHSADAGATWTALATLSQVGMRGLARDRNGTWIAAEDHGDVATSADASTWTWAGTVNQIRVVDVAPDSPENTSAPLVTPPTTAHLRAWPNPFRSRIRFALGGAPNGVALEIVDVTGRRVADLSELRASDGTWSWRPGLAAQSVYFVRARWPEGSAAVRVVHIR